MKKIQLTKGKTAIVDDADFEVIVRHKWYVNKNGRTWYALRTIRKNGKKTSISMHRFINKTPQGMETDHINGNGLDNRRKNLRSCTRSENQRNRTRLALNNTSGISGVSWYSPSKKWCARGTLRGRSIYLGYFNSKKEAAEAVKSFLTKIL